MRIIAAIMCACVFGGSALAETVIAKRTIRAQEVIGAADLDVVAGTTPGTAFEVAQVAGLEARRIIYAGRPVPLNGIGPPALVERNGLVSLAFKTSGLTIRTEGRAMARGGLGDRIRVINLESRSSVSGVIDQSGTVWVGQ